MNRWQRGFNSVSMLVFTLAFWSALFPGCARESDKGVELIGSDTYFKAERAPYALLWMADSAEYEAICLQTYNLALAHVRAEVKMIGTVAEDKPLAVVMDLDETVLDNLGYMTWLYETGQGVSWDKWSHWEQHHGGEVKLIPGALDFIREVEALDIVICYISNREHPTRKYTVQTLVDQGIIKSADNVNGANSVRLQLYTDTSDKGPRRQRVLERFHVIAWLGDNLGDFPGGFRPATGTERKQQVRDQKHRFGTGYFIFPNPTYGAWLKYIDANSPGDHLPRPVDCGHECPMR